MTWAGLGTSFAEADWVSVDPARVSGAWSGGLSKASSEAAVLGDPLRAGDQFGNLGERAPLCRGCKVRHRPGRKAGVREQISSLSVPPLMLPGKPPRPTTLSQKLSPHCWTLC